MSNPTASVTHEDIAKERNLFEDGKITVDDLGNKIRKVANDKARDIGRKIDATKKFVPTRLVKDEKGDYNFEVVQKLPI